MVARFFTITANGLWLGDFAAKRRDFYRQDRTFYGRKITRLGASQQCSLSQCYHLLQLYQRSRFCSKRIRSFHTQSFQAKILLIDKQPTQIIPWKNLILKMVDFRLRFSSPVFPQQFSAQLARLENGFWKAKFRGVESFGKIGERQARFRTSVSQR